MPKLSTALKKIRASKLVKDLQSVGGNQSLLARKQGRTRQAVSHQLKKPYVQERLADLLEQAGVTDNVLVEKIKEGLDAEETKFFAEKGVVNDSRETIDFVTRHKYIETAAKLKGHLSKDSNKDPLQVLQVFQSIDPETLGAIDVATRIERIEAVLKNQLSKKS